MEREIIIISTIYLVDRILPKTGWVWGVWQGSLGVEQVRALHTGSPFLRDLLAAGPRAEGPTEVGGGAKISCHSLLHHCAEGWPTGLVLL